MNQRLHCPNCDTVIPVEQINIQKTLAVCPNCATVFNFGDEVPSNPKVKRRKIKQPDHIEQTETDDALVLEMPMVESWNYRILMGGAGAVFLTLYTLMMLTFLSEGDLAPMVIFSIMLLPFAVGLLSSLFMKQMVQLDSDGLQHIIKLMGATVYKRAVDANDLEDVTIEETTNTRESIAEARYNVYTQKIDGRQDMFMQNLTESTAMYLQQVLSSYLNEGDVPTSRLVTPYNQTDAISDDDMTLMQSQMMGSE